ncbi:MAG: Fic family protein [Acidobacteriota bacterium]
MTLDRFRLDADAGRLDVPVSVAWLLAELGEFRGRQTLYTRQSAQRLKALREHAVIESAISSTRIEGVTVAPDRHAAVLRSRARLRDRDEAEVRGYRDAVSLVHERHAQLGLSEETILRLHRLCRPGSGDTGSYKRVESDIMERLATGETRVRFRTVSARRTPGAMKGLIAAARRLEDGHWVPPLLCAAAFNLDFLRIHPFRDGNGRVSRLLLLLQTYRAGFDVGRYVSLERVIEEHKDRYYETLEISSTGWHDHRHDPWPYINYLLYVLRTAYAEFERRAGQAAEPKGTKTAAVLDAIGRAPGTFSVSELARTCPAVSLDMIRRVLKDQQREGQVLCLGRGPGARWRRVGS